MGPEVKGEKAQGEGNVVGLTLFLGEGRPERSEHTALARVAEGRHNLVSPVTYIYFTITNMCKQRAHCEKFGSLCGRLAREIFADRPNSLVHVVAAVQDIAWLTLPFFLLGSFYPAFTLDSVASISK